MKVLLVVTPSHPQTVGLDHYIFTEPIALEYIGAGIQGNHDVKLLDLRIKTEPALKETLESFKPDIIGCGAYTADVYTTKQIFAEAKKICPDILTVVGGHHATVMPQDMFEDYIDVVIIGEGVGPFKKICDHHEKKKSFEEIENVYYRKNGANGQMTFTLKKEHPSLDSLPFPARNLISHIRDKYCAPTEGGIVPFATVRGSLGCIYNCKFCATSRLFKNKMYMRSTDNILEELATIEEPFILWADDEFIVDVKRTVSLAKAIDKAGIKKIHTFLGRSDNIIKNPECIEEWAKVGLVQVIIGLESHSDKDLKEMRKGTTLSKNEESIRICHANNVKARGNFIIHPYYTKEDFKKLTAYVRKLDLDVATFSVMTPFPGTDLYEEVKDDLTTHNYNFFDMAHSLMPTKLPLKSFYKQYSNLYKKTATFKKKMNLLFKMEPNARRVLLSNVSDYLHRLQNAYRDQETEQLN